MFELPKSNQNCNIVTYVFLLILLLLLSSSAPILSYYIMSSILGSLLRANSNLQKCQTPKNILTQIRTATKKAGGSTNNGRDSAGRRLGVKAHHDTKVNAGSIIIRQRGKKWYPGENVGMGKDHTLFAKVEGVVAFSNHSFKRNKKVVNVMSANS